MLIGSLNSHRDGGELRFIAPSGRLHFQVLQTRPKAKEALRRPTPDRRRPPPNRPFRAGATAKVAHSRAHPSHWHRLLPSS